MPTDKRQRQKQGRLERMEAERRAAQRQARRRRFITGVGIAIVVVTILAFIAIFGQGERGEDDVATDEGTGSTVTTDATTAPTEPTTPSTIPRKEKPGVEIPEGEPPTELRSIDLIAGDGATVTAGQTAVVDYVGATFADGEEFDTSFDGEPFPFRLGAGDVIPGWDQGVEGMRVGGRRTLVIPPDLAYGERGSGEDIPPDATLVFVIDLLGVGEAAAAPAG